MTEEDIVASWSERVRAATASNTPLRIRGGGTKDWYGQTLQGESVDTRAHRGIIEYDPAELVITAKAGTPLSEIEARLDECGQMLPFEPPHFGLNATLGGCIAAGLAGPRRAARFRARRGGDERTGPGVAFWRPGGEERGGLRRLAAARRLARHAWTDPGGIGESPAETRCRSHAQVRDERHRRRAQAQRME